MAKDNLDISTVVNSADYWLHRYEEDNDAFRYIHVPRDLHRNLTFITDEHLPKDIQTTSFSRQDLSQFQPKTGPVHFIFHSAYCCSTMLARAFDIPGVSMGLKEPQVLNDMIGWRRRGAQRTKWYEVLNQTLNLLARPFSNGESVVVKPSNICTPLITPILKARPKAKALLLYAPIESYLQSIAKKEMWGRIWVRDVLIGMRQDGYLISGFEADDLLKLTDLQVAAIGWLSQHMAFGNLVSQFGIDRVKTLDSDTLLARSPDAMDALTHFFNLKVDSDQLAEVLDGPAFNSHSKLDQNESGKTFDAQSRRAEQDQVASQHGAEIEMVSKWSEAVLESQGLQFDPGSALLANH